MNTDPITAKTVTLADKSETCMGLLRELRLSSENGAFFIAAVLLFFIAVALFSRFARKSHAPAKVEASIKLAIVGLALFAAESCNVVSSSYANAVLSLESLIILICAANLLIFLLTDVYVHFRTKREVPSFLRDLIALMVYLVFAIISLRVIFHIDISSIVTTTTVLTATIAFAMQNTLTNVLSGFSIQSDSNLRKNAWISVKDKDIVGKIENVGFRYTSLKTTDNSIVMVPNNLLMQNVVTALAGENAPETSLISLDIGLGYDLPPAKAKRILLRVLKEENGIVHDPPPRVMVTRFSDSSVDYRLKYALTDYGDRDPVKDRLYTRIWYTVHREGYGFPYPHREIITAPDQTAPFTVDREEIRNDLQKISIFDTLNEQDKDHLVAHSLLRVYGPGEQVVREGESGESLFMVIRGELLVYQKGVKVGTLGPEDFFGEMSLLTGERRQATVIAEHEVWLTEIAKEAIESVFKGNPEIMEVLSAVLAEREEINAERRKSSAKGKVSLTKKDEYLLKLKSYFGL